MKARIHKRARKRKEWVLLRIEERDGELYAVLPAPVAEAIKEAKHARED